MTILPPQSVGGCRHLLLSHSCLWLQKRCGPEQSVEFTHPLMHSGTLPSPVGTLQLPSWWQMTVAERTEDPWKSFGSRMYLAEEANKMCTNYPVKPN